MNGWTVTGFCADDTVQGLVSWRTSVKSFDVAKQCTLLLTDDPIDAWKTSCNSNVYVIVLLLRVSVVDSLCKMSEVCACSL